MSSIDVRLCQSRHVKSCGPSGSQDLAFLRSERSDPLPVVAHPQRVQARRRSGAAGHAQRAVPSDDTCAVRRWEDCGVLVSSSRSSPRHASSRVPSLTATAATTSAAAGSSHQKPKSGCRGGRRGRPRPVRRRAGSAFPRPWSRPSPACRRGAAWRCRGMASR
jgi:hypothetical protein